MKHTFVFREGKSQKFWNIDIKKTVFTVDYGRLGTAGQSLTKTFETEEKCQKEANKLISEKIKKGYKELAKGTAMPDRIESKKSSNKKPAPKKKESVDKLGNGTVPCYFLKIDDGKPTPLDSSIGGIPYCPVGEELPKNKNGKEIPLLLQINFNGIDLHGYPNKGIFQLYMGDVDDYTNYDDLINKGSCVRFYKNSTDNYRKDIPYSNNILAGPCVKRLSDNKRHFKLKLEKGWSLPELPEEGISNIGGYGYGSQGEIGIPRSAARLSPKTLGLHDYPDPILDDIMLFLAEDIISFGDCGCIFYFYRDITKLKKDMPLEGICSM